MWEMAEFLWKGKCTTISEIISDIIYDILFLFDFALFLDEWDWNEAGLIVGPIARPMSALYIFVPWNEYTISMT